MRARVILYNKENKAVLLIHRLKNGRNYWVIHGGAENNEAPVDTAIREINEELNIHLKSADLIHFFKCEGKEYEEFFYTEIPYIVAPKINGEEKERSSSDNVYQPEWITVKEVTKINLMPPEIAAKIVTLI